MILKITKLIGIEAISVVTIHRKMTYCLFASPPVVGTSATDSHDQAHLVQIGHTPRQK